MRTFIPRGFTSMWKKGLNNSSLTWMMMNLYRIYFRKTERAKKPKRRLDRSCTMAMVIKLWWGISSTLSIWERYTLAPRGVSRRLWCLTRGLIGWRWRLICARTALVKLTTPRDLRAQLRSKRIRLIKNMAVQISLGTFGMILCACHRLTMDTKALHKQDSASASMSSHLWPSRRSRG